MDEKNIYKTIANVINNELKFLLKKYDMNIQNCGIQPQHMSILCKLFHERAINKKRLVALLEGILKINKMEDLTPEQKSLATSYICVKSMVPFTDLFAE